ncbi:MAG: hypothetical protein F6K30_13985 [Cyanothece sp. SIO2G6]|nr:hypothetical protein [Cyanothece sp. SIO2G6]
MPITDANLAAQMHNLLIAGNVAGPQPQPQPLLNQENRDDILANGIHNQDIQVVLPMHADASFMAYWAALGAWMEHNGGDIEATTGVNVVGRDPVDPGTIAGRAIYNDCFRDVLVHMEQGNNNVAHAVANHLRFINAFMEAD